MQGEGNTTLIIQIINLYKKQEGQYSVLLELLHEQKQAIEKHDFNTYTLIGEKINSVFGEIESCLKLINEEKKLLKKQLELHDDGSIPKEETKILESLQEKHTKALSINNQSEMLLKEYMAQLKNESKKINLGKQTAEAYKTDYKPTPRFIDDKS